MVKLVTRCIATVSTLLSLGYDFTVYIYEVEAFVMALVKEHFMHKMLAFTLTTLLLNGKSYALLL